MSGFETQVQKNVEVTAGANVRLDFALRVGGLAEEVVVSGRTTMVETRNATQSNLIDDQRVQDLPDERPQRRRAGRHLRRRHRRSARARTRPTAVRGRSCRSTAAITNHNLFTLNGSVFTHFNQTTGFNPPPPDAIQEIRIQTHNFSAEYGHTAGSQVSIVSKAGTNTFHGTAWEFHRNSALNARSFFQTRKPEQEQNQAGASAGGAVIRNKLFWFGSYQRLWDRSEAGSSQTIVPTDAQRAGNFTALSTALRNPVNPITGAAVHRQLGGALRRRQRHQRRAASARSRRPARARTCPRRRAAPSSRCPPRRAITRSTWPGATTTSPARNQLNAHFFADRSDSSSWPGNVNYVQQSVFSDVNQFGVSDTHIFSPRLVNELTFSYLTSRSGGGALTQIAPRDQGVNVDVGNDGRGMSYSVSGSINLAYPGVNAQDYYELAGQGHDDLQRRQPHAEVGVRVHPARLRVQPGADCARRTSPGTRTGNADRGLHDRGVRQLDDRIRDCRSQPVAR